MRFINLEKIERKLGTEHIDSLNAAASEVKRVYLNTEAELASDKSNEKKQEIAKRISAIIDKHAIIWSNLKTLYEEHFHKKCWYTESRNPGSSKDIDHFRPKNEVFEDEIHPGYWWLAFDWENYRYSCQFANRMKKNPETEITGGKGTHFPLLNPSTRIYSPDQDYRTEDKMLLDPCTPGDDKLLSFQINGRPILHCKFENDPDAKIKVETSVMCMNLDYPTFNEERELLYLEIKKIVKEADNSYKRFVQDRLKNLADQINFKNRIADLEDKQNENSVYSRAAQEFIRNFREYEWVDKYLIN